MVFGGGNGGVTLHLGAVGLIGIPAVKVVAPCAGGCGQGIVFAAVGYCVGFRFDLSACRVDPAAVGIKDYQIFLGCPVGIQCGGWICADGGGFGYFCAADFFGIPAVKAVACAVGRGQCAVGAADGHRCACRADPAAVGIKSYEVRRGRDRACSLCLIAVVAAVGARNPDAEIFGNIFCASCGVDKVEAFGCRKAYGRGFTAVFPHHFLNDIGICITAANRRFYRISVWYARIKYRRRVGSGNIPQIHYLKRSIRGRSFVGTGVRPVQRNIKRYGVGRVGGDCNRDGNFLIAQLEVFVVPGVKADAYTAAGQRGTAGTRGGSGGACTIGHGVGVLLAYSVLVDLALCGKFYGQVARRRSAHRRNAAQYAQAQRSTQNPFPPRQGIVPPLPCAAQGLDSGAVSRIMAV